MDASCNISWQCVQLVCTHSLLKNNSQCIFIGYIPFSTPPPLAYKYSISSQVLLIALSSCCIPLHYWVQYLLNHRDELSPSISELWFVFVTLPPHFFYWKHFICDEFSFKLCNWFHQLWPNSCMHFLVRYPVYSSFGCFSFSEYSPVFWNQVQVAEVQEGHWNSGGPMWWGRKGDTRQQLFGCMASAIMALGTICSWVANSKYIDVCSLYYTDSLVFLRTVVANVRTASVSTRKKVWSFCALHLVLSYFLSEVIKTNFLLNLQVSFLNISWLSWTVHCQWDLLRIFHEVMA